MKLPEIVADMASVCREEALDENRVKYWLHELKLHYSDLSDRPILRLIEFASTKFHIDLVTRTPVRAFAIRHSAVTLAKLRGYGDRPRRGRNHELVIESEQTLVDWLTSKVANHMATNRTELLHECNGRFGRSITRGWVDSFLRRHANQLFETKSISQENPRLDVPRAFLEAVIDGFRDHVHNACAELVFILARLESVNGKIAMRGG
jgi:hypothetical protein